MMHFNQQLRDKLDSILKTNIPSNGVPGARFVAIAKDGTVIYSGSAGTRSQGTDEPISKDTVFWIASCTKLLTALCAMKCVDLGLITLDEDVLPYLPELQQQQVIQNYGTPEFKLVPREGIVTLRQLLTMTAGTSYPILGLLLERFPTIPTGTEPFMNPIKSEVLGPFECQPGTKWAYSGAMDWAGQLVEQLSGQSLGDFLQKHISIPCGVPSGGITFHLTPEMESKLAGAHFRWPDGRVTPRGKIFSTDKVEMHLGGAGAYSTSDAYSHILLPLLNEGRHPITGHQVLKPETVKEMLKPQLNEEQLKWLYQPTAANNMQVIFPGIAKQWGLGFMLLPEGTNGGRGAGSATWAGFPNTHWIVDPTNGIAMVLFGQLIPQEDPKLLEARDQCERAIYDYLKGHHSSSS